MAYNTNPFGSPDGAVSVVGSSGARVRQDSNDRMEGVMFGGQDEKINQEPGTGKPIIRRGGGEKDADVDIATADSPRDLTSDGDFSSGTRTTGGAEALAGHIKDDDGNTFDVEIDWLDNNGNVLITHAPASLTNVSDIQFNLITRSDRFELKVKDNTGATKVHGTANAH